MPLLNGEGHQRVGRAEVRCGAGCAVAPLVPGALGQIVSGFMAFSAVMLLKCLRRMAASELVVRSGLDGGAHGEIHHAITRGQLWS